MPKIEFVANPGAPSLPSSSPQQNKAESARAKAIAMLSGGTQNQSQQTPVQNPSQVSPEETTNLNSSQSQEASGQNDSIVTPETTEENTAAPEATKEATQALKEDKPLSSQFAVLARKERALRDREQAFKAKELAFNSKQYETPPSTQIDTSKYISIEELKRNAFSALQKYGISYDDVSAQAIQAQSPEAQMIAQMREEIQAELRQVREEQAKTSKSIEDQQSNSYKNAVQQITVETNALVNSDERFEMIKATQSSKDVVELIERTFKEDNILLSVEEAAQQVEEYLEQEAVRLAGLKKVQAKMNPKPAQSLAPQASATPQTKDMKTLSNSVTTTRQLSARERAILAAQGKLT